MCVTSDAPPTAGPGATTPRVRAFHGGYERITGAADEMSTDSNCKPTVRFHGHW
jgi:hypothetical protein